MGAYRFVTGLRFRWQGVAYEMLRLLPEGKVCIENIALASVREVAVELLVTALFKGELSILTPFETPSGKSNPDRHRALDLSDYPEGRAAVARYRLEVIQPLLALAPRERTAEVIAARVAHVRASTPDQDRALLKSVSRRSIFRWLRCYEQSGQDIRTLLPATDQRGGKGQSRLDPEVNAIIEQTIRALYLMREKASIDDVLQEVAVRIVEANRLRPASEHLSLPSRLTLYRRINALDLRERFTARYGKHAARRQFKQYGKAPAPSLPLERVEIDHTKADLIVVDDEDDLPLGRFTITYCLDIATRYPCGFYLGFEPPSYYTVMECLYHAIQPKDNLVEKYGTQHTWGLYGIPSGLVVDNGPEFIGRSLDDACYALGTTLIRAPVKTPEFKAGIERHLGTLTVMVLQKIPGTTFANPRARGDYDSVGQACVYLSEVERIMNLFVVDIYAEKPHPGLAGGVPARRWETAVAAGLAPRVPASADDLRILLGRVDSRVITHAGIEFECLRYNAPELALLRHRLKGERTKIKYHPGDLSRLYVFDPFEHRYLEAPACDPEGYTDHLSLWQHRIIRTYALHQADKPDLAALGRAKRDIRQIVQNAKGRKPQRTRSKIARWQSQPPSLQAADTAPSSPDSVAEGALLAPAQANEAPPSPSSHAGWEVTFDLPGHRMEDRFPL